MITISSEEVIELPVDELALRVLADLLTEKEWNQYNYALRYRNGDLDGHRPTPDAVNAVAEALGWLTSHGMLARKPGDTNADAIFVTRRGRAALNQNLVAIRSIERLQDNLHPLLQRKVRRQFLLGEYENAIFVAMKAVEVRVRALSGFGDDMIGVDLMIKAFKSGGPLADAEAPPGEVDGTTMLFRGAYAVLRNPSGHREVSFEDVTEASEAVMTASLLMRMLDKIEARLTAAS